MCPRFKYWGEGTFFIFFTFLHTDACQMKSITPEGFLIQQLLLMPMKIIQKINVLLSCPC